VKRGFCLLRGKHGIPDRGRSLTFDLQSIQGELIFVDTAEQFYASDRDSGRFEVLEAKHTVCFCPTELSNTCIPIGHPVLNETGDLVEFLGTTIDATEQTQARIALENALTEVKLLRDQLYKENLALRDEVDRVSMFEEILGTSPALQAVVSRVVKVAPTDSSVLITGETGTGKELIARAIHKRSARSQRAFVSVNCAALARSLISSELFGHEKGAFTGATQRKLGRFELANGGTIFLDEIGGLPADIQVALLRVLHKREFERVGGTQSILVNVRVVAATNRDLEDAIANGTFRRDLFYLFYRLNVFPIQVHRCANGRTIF
jgi:transcriptional regulator with GAF, ATPase, and Fis domain